MEGMTDHEAAVAASLGYHELADYLAAHAEEDTFILGVGQAPRPQAHLVPVIRGTEEQRKARVDDWARVRHVAAFWHEETGTYRAVKMFGPVPYVAYMIPDPPASRDGADARKALAA
jgi:hypothetical protein